MKILYITPGFGNKFYCQNCLRDNELYNSIKKMGHEVLILPMYLPVKFDRSFKNNIPIFFGAINLFLKEKFKIFQKAPKWIENFFNLNPFLKLASNMSGATNAKNLEDITLSILRGEQGSQKKELEVMIEWLKNNPKPDVVHLSNALLIGLAHEIKKELNIPVFCTLQDEDSWINSMEEPYQSEAWNIIKQKVSDIDCFLSVSLYYAKTMQKFMNIPEEKLTIVPVGIKTYSYSDLSLSFSPPTIGYLSRLTPSLGLNILIEAFIILKKEKIYSDLRMRISGGFSTGDKKYVEKMKNRIKKTGLTQHVDLKPFLYKEDINAFLDKLSLLSVPISEGDAFGVYLIEAMAAGIPVVQPDCASYREIINITNGGILYFPNTPQQLALSLKKLLDNPDYSRELGENGRKIVNKKFAIKKIADQYIKIYTKWIN